jgi:hypothetical protein
MVTWRNGLGGLVAVAILGLSGCSSGEGPDHVKMPVASMPNLPPPPAAAALDPAALAAPHYDAVLVSGDRSRSVGDDAVQTLHDRLAAIGTPTEHLHPLSADPKRFTEDFYLAPTAPGKSRGDDESREERIRKIPGGTDPASPALVLRRVLELDGKSGATCLVYLVSTPDGKSMNLRDGTISPDQLDRALGGSCGDAPTVVIVSGCNSGDWAAAPMARPNRLILTASAAGRTGFGCGPNAGFTTFDECFLGAVDGAPDWASIFARTRTCVQRREALVEQPSVDPQIYLGPLVASLPAPWRSAAGPDGVARDVIWRQGIGRYSLDGTPYYPVLRRRNQEALDAYRRAPSPKALALTLAGTVAWAAGVTGGETPDDVARIALQLCEWQSDGACILYARGDGIGASGAAGFPPLHPPMLARSGGFDPALVPFIRDDERAGLDAYRSQGGAKALALGPATESWAVGTGADLAAARAAALSACESKGAPCVVYAEGDRVVLGYRH